MKLMVGECLVIELEKNQVEFYCVDENIKTVAHSSEPTFVASPGFR